jgi:dihydrodipicolinate synthase/N-acetylneuraminate lyase
MLNLDGVSVALVTPWREGWGVDAASLERIVRRACDAGVVAVCPAGTTGEGPRLSRGQRVELVRSCAALVPEHVGVVGGVSSGSLGETLAELEAQAAAGADAALVTPPTRMPLGADGCRRFYAELADRAPLPLIIYHIPALTGVPVPAEVVVELAAHASIIGLKDSAADMQYHLRVADGLADGGIDGFALLTGTDALLVGSMQAGGAGAILASGNLVPELGVGVHRAVRAGDIAHALAVARRLRAIVIACRRGNLPAGWKAALELTGCGSRVAVPPGESLDAVQVEALRRDLERLGVLA